MSFIDRGDVEFERALRHSARRDAPAADATARAWSRFALRLATSAKLESPESVAASPAARPVSRFRNAVATAKWVVLGAIGGSAVTFALVGRHAGPPARAISPGLPSSLRDPSADAPGEAAPSPREALPPQPGASAASVPSVLPSPGPALARRAPPLPNVPRRGLAAPLEASTLAAEVAALDAARSALDAGAPDDALALLHRYLLDFPKGKLVPEAEVLAIEACAEKGDRLRVTREATRFLERYPNAPQRTRVEQLRREASPRQSPASP